MQVHPRPPMDERIRVNIESLKMLRAARDGDVAGVKDALQAGALVTFMDWSRCNSPDAVTALHCACKNGHQEVVKVLLEAYSPEQVAQDLARPVRCVCTGLVTSPHAAQWQHDETCLSQACKHGHTEIVKLFCSPEFCPWKTTVDGKHNEMAAPTDRYAPQRQRCLELLASTDNLEGLQLMLSVCLPQVCEMLLRSRAGLRLTARFARNGRVLCLAPVDM